MTATAYMTHVEDLGGLVDVEPNSTASAIALTAEGARVKLFAFDAGQKLNEHTAPMPVLLQVLDGRLRVTADGRTVDLEPGALIHLRAQAAHAVEAVTPARLMVTMIDVRQPE